MDQSYAPSVVIQRVRAAAKLALITVLLSLVPVACATPKIEWVRQFGGIVPVSDFAQAVDADANVYVSGCVDGVLPGQSAAGGTDVFVRKYDANGSELWTRQFGSSGSEQALGIAVDATGVYVGGYTSGTLPGQTGLGGWDAFVRTYDLAGEVAWTRQFGTPADDRAYGITSDAAAVYVVGNTGGTLPGQTSSGSTDAFVRAYRGGGGLAWTLQFGTAGLDEALGVAVDATGAYVVGYTDGTFASQASTGNRDAYVARIVVSRP